MLAKSYPFQFNHLPPSQVQYPFLEPHHFLDDTHKLQMQFYQELRNQLVRQDLMEVPVSFSGLNTPQCTLTNLARPPHSSGSTITDINEYNDPIIATSESYFPAYTSGQMPSLNVDSKMSVLSDYLETSEFDHSVTTSMYDTGLSFQAYSLSDPGVSRLSFASTHHTAFLHLPHTPVFGDTPIFSESSVLTPNSSIAEDAVRLLCPPKLHQNSSVSNRPLQMVGAESFPSSGHSLINTTQPLATQPLADVSVSKPTNKRQKTMARDESRNNATPKKHTRKHTLARSRNGCWVCRIKHLKCDETRPVCSNCTRFGIQCDYSPNRPSYVSNSELRRQKLEATTSLKRRPRPVTSQAQK